MAGISGITGVLLLIALLAGIAPAGSARAEDDRDAIVTVIRRQLDALRADRGDEAFSYAAPSVQRRFGTSERFMGMVRTAYAPLYRARSVHFLDLVTVGSAPTQRVLVIGPDGAAVLAFYDMERQPAGEWRIGGCVLKRFADRPA